MAGKRRITLEILGDAKGLAGALGDAEGRLGRFGSVAAGAGKLAAGALLGVATAAAGVGGALFKIGSDFDNAYDTIRIGTGASGDALEGLEESFRNVVTTVPTDFGSASTAIADLNTRLGLTGPDLEAVSSQVLELSRITGSDLSTNVENVSRVFGDWGVATGEQTDALDMLFRASQATGPSVDRIGAMLVQYGAPMRQLGFTFEESAALLGQFEQQGVNTELVMGSMRQALGKMARDGEPAVETFERVTDQIKNAGSASEANALALELFGARAGPDMAAAIREGRFEVGALVDQIANGEDTINKAADDTADFGERWTLLKNRVLVGLEPLAMRVFDAIGTAMDTVAPIVEGLVEAFSEDGLSGALAYIGDVFDRVWPDVQRALGNLGRGLMSWVSSMAPVLAAQLGEWGRAFLAWVGPQIPPLLTKLGELIGQAANWLLESGLPMLTNALINLGNELVAWIGPQIPPALAALAALLAQIAGWIITEAAPRLAGEALKLAGSLLSWTARLLPDALAGIGGFLTTLVGRIPGLFAGLVGAFGTAGGDLARSLLGGIGDAITGAVGWASDLATGLWNRVKGIINDNIIRPIRDFRVGGWGPLPDFQPFGSVPLLAHGGVITSPTLAWIGEDHRTTPEIVTPEDLMRQVVREEAGGGTGGPGVAFYGPVTIGDRHTVADLDWWARTRTAGV